MLMNTKWRFYMSDFPVVVGYYENVRLSFANVLAGIYLANLLFGN